MSAIFLCPDDNKQIKGRIMSTFLKCSGSGILLGTLVIVASCDVPTDIPKRPSDSSLVPKIGVNEVKSETKPEANDSTSEKHNESPLANLSAEDLALVEAQRFCPVSGEKLGSKGPPVKMTVKGETFFLCCPECQPQIDTNPDKYLTKVAELKKGGTEGSAPIP